MIKTTTLSGKTIEWTFQGKNQDDADSGLLLLKEGLLTISKNLLDAEKKYFETPLNIDPFYGMGEPEKFKETKQYAEQEFIKCQDKFNEAYNSLKDAEIYFSEKGFSVSDYQLPENLNQYIKRSKTTKEQIDVDSKPTPEAKPDEIKAWEKPLNQLAIEIHLKSDNERISFKKACDNYASKYRFKGKVVTYKMLKSSWDAKKRA